jgi:signal transduction histidine kinase
MDANRTYLQTPDQWARFLSALTHELRTPMASLRLLSDLLARSSPRQPGSQEERYASNVEEVIQDLQALVGEVAELASLMGGRVKPRWEEISLGKLIDEVREAVRPWAWDRGIALTESLDPALPKLLRTDGDRLRQLLSFLLGAAVSQAESGIFFRIDAEDGGLRVVISSDGQPYSEAALLTLFEPFDVGVKSTRRRGGRSLALPLANELARVLGATLQGANRGGRPTFDLTVPAKGG